MGVDAKEAVQLVHAGARAASSSSRCCSPRSSRTARSSACSTATTAGCASASTELGVIQFEDWADTGEEYAMLDEVAKDRAAAEAAPTASVRPAGGSCAAVRLRVSRVGVRSCCAAARHDGLAAGLDLGRVEAPPACQSRGDASPRAPRPRRRYSARPRRRSAASAARRPGRWRRCRRRAAGRRAAARRGARRGSRAPTPARSSASRKLPVGDISLARRTPTACGQQHGEAPARHDADPGVGVGEAGPARRRRGSRRPAPARSRR